MNPWDIRAALLAKHAQHVVLIHFPIALFLAGVVLDLAASWTRRRDLAMAAYCNLSLAAVSSLPTVATGLLAWQWELEGRRLKGIVLLHLLSGCASGLLMLAIWWIHRTARRHPEKSLPDLRWPLELLAVLAVGLTGHLGGFLSGVNHT
ncbi:MAG: DUF2231 domain-containing protein [Acidobacteriia bacterium]|nr:DUF2231 domain-containing protein [Terriglobia bacterium]